MGYFGKKINGKYVYNEYCVLSEDSDLNVLKC